MTAQLDALVALIARRADTCGRWHVTTSELCALLGLDLRECHCRLYQAATAERSVLEIGDIVRGFSHEHPELLVVALEALCEAEVEQRLERAGVFFAHASRLQILEAVVEASARLAATHVYAEDEFTAMLRVLKAFETACSTYFAAHLARSTIVQAATEEFCRGRTFDIPPLAEANVRRLIELFFQRHLLSEQTLFPGLYERMHREAIRQGYVRVESPPPADAVGDPVEAAKRALGVEGLPISRRLLREHYRRLMKCYHPDVNPAGAEKAKEINAAYSRLLAALC